MNVSRFLTTPATVTPREPDDERDEYGNVVEGEGEPFDTFCFLDQPRRDEQTGIEPTQAERWIVYLPPDTPLDGGDRIDIGSQAFEVTGPPSRQANPLNVGGGVLTADFVAANLVRVT